MIHIPPLRTRRLTVQLRELTIGESIELANMPPDLFQAETTSFLRKVTAKAQGVEDPAHWTVQERMLAVCQYLAATLPDGPDFAIGEGRYSDYLDGAKDYPAAPVDGGDVGGDFWQVRHLTGAMAESIERMEGEVEGAAGRLHWLIGCMAAQLVIKGQEAIDPSIGEGAFDEFLVARMRAFLAYPEAEFAALLSIFSTGRAALSHLFRVDIADDGGLVALAKGGEAVNLPPARFPVGSCISELAKELAGRAV